MTSVNREKSEEVNYEVAGAGAGGLLAQKVSRNYELGLLPNRNEGPWTYANKDMYIIAVGLKFK